MTDQENYSSGAFDDYCYETQGIYAMTLELWDLDLRCGIKHFWDEDPKEHVDNESENFAKRLTWIQENAPEAFKPWTEFDHPQLGKVEIGGFDWKFTIQNAPKHLLTQECEKITKFMVRWAKCMPRLVIDCVKAEKLAENSWKIEAVVSNAGFLPTYLSEKAKKLGVAKTVTVAIDCAEGLVSGEAETDLGDLSSYALTKTGYHYYGNIDTETSPQISKKVTWIYNGPAKDITVTASTPKGGVAVKTISLH